MARTVRGMRPCCPQKVAICSMSEDDLLDMDYFLNEDDI